MRISGKTVCSPPFTADRKPMAENRVDSLMKDPRRGLLLLAWPVIVSSLFTVLLNFVDAFFVGGLGPEALAAMQTSFPIFGFMLAIGVGLTIGANAVIAKRLGEKNKEWAEETALHCLFLTLLVSIGFTLLAFLSPQIAAAMGGGPVVQKMASDYIGVILAGSAVMFFSFALASILQAEGDTKTRMKAAAVMTMVNVILDPIFIYQFNMGVGGAAMATVIAQLFALAMYARMVLHKRSSYLQLRLKEFRYTPQIITSILKIGVPSMVVQMTLSITVIGFNLLLAGFGDDAISAYGIGFRADSLAIMPILGLAAGVVTMVGYYRGARDYRGARKVYMSGLKYMLVFSLLGGATMFLISDFLPHVFTADAEVISLASQYMKIIGLAYPFIGATIIISSAFQGLGRGLPSMVITMARAVLVAIPAAWLLGYGAGMGPIGVLLAIPVSAVFSSAFAVIWIEKCVMGMRERREA